MSIYFWDKKKTKGVENLLHNGRQWYCPKSVVVRVSAVISFNLIWLYLTFPTRPQLVFLIWDNNFTISRFCFVFCVFLLFFFCSFRIGCLFKKLVAKINHVWHKWSNLDHLTFLNFLYYTNQKHSNNQKPSCGQIWTTCATVS